MKKAIIGVSVGALLICAQAAWALSTSASVLDGAAPETEASVIKDVPQKGADIERGPVVLDQVGLGRDRAVQERLLQDRLASPPLPEPQEEEVEEEKPRPQPPRRANRPIAPCPDDLLENGECPSYTTNSVVMVTGGLAAAAVVKVVVDRGASN